MVHHLKFHSKSSESVFGRFAKQFLDISAAIFCRILPLFGSCGVVVVSMTNLKFSFLLNLHPINPAKAEEKSSNALGSISAAPSQFAESQKLQGGNDELVNVVNNSDWATILCEASFFRECAPFNGILLF